MHVCMLITAQLQLSGVLLQGTRFSLLQRLLSCSVIWLATLACFMGDGSAACMHPCRANLLIQCAACLCRGDLQRPWSTTSWGWHSQSPDGPFCSVSLSAWSCCAVLWWPARQQTLSPRQLQCVSWACCAATRCMQAGNALRPVLHQSCHPCCRQQQLSKSGGQRGTGWAETLFPRCACCHAWLQQPPEQLKRRLLRQRLWQQAREPLRLTRLARLLPHPPQLLGTR